MITTENREKLKKILKGRQKMVAEAAGVSETIVSRFLRGESYNENVENAAIEVAEKITSVAGNKNSRVEKLNL